MHNLLLSKSRASLFMLLLPLQALAIGCGNQAPGFREPVDLLDSPVVLKDTLVFVDAHGNRAFLFNAAAEKPAPDAKQIALPFGPLSAERRNNKDPSDTTEEALVLCEGRRSSTTAAAEHAALAAVTRAGVVRSYDLGTTPFDTLVQSDDGRYAVLFRSGKDESRLLNNANALVVIDLDEKPTSKAAVTPKTPPSFGHRPTKAVFSPMMTIAEEKDRRLLVVLSAAEVTLIDLNHLDHRETVVQLGGPDSPTVDPEQVLFDAAHATLYVRGASSNDIFAFTLEAHTNPDGNDFRPSINQLGGGSMPRDMALFNDPANPTSPRLLVAAQGSQQAIVVDPSSSKATPITLPFFPSHVLLFDATSPHDKSQAPATTRALIYGDNVAAVAFLDLADIENRKGRNLEELKAGGTISSLIPLLDENRVVLMQGTGVSLLDLAQRTVAPVTASTALSNALFDGKNKRLWVGPSDQARIGTLDLTSGATDEVLLDSNITQLVPMFDIGKLAAIHTSAIGYLTLVDAKQPSRDKAASVRGFLIAHVLDRGEP